MLIMDRNRFAQHDLMIFFLPYAFVSFGIKQLTVKPIRKTSVETKISILGKSGKSLHFFWHFCHRKVTNYVWLMAIKRNCLWYIELRTPSKPKLAGQANELQTKKSWLTLPSKLAKKQKKKLFNKLLLIYTAYK